ncbi:MAG: hypothetical protein AUJ92_22235 [Armatimonadetes bacterium CG2_30_59_28]|nr:type II toxin-antitoxin system death-on-curing family toxin [Armatimonadota bacterium]OIO89125.1 MAG: hypothetical protein AUJ92_22235 [Armatimonadetes bacterium CG2_30_59_28]PIU64517.1 MAG: type II toxin-antitoxin system death-on-curing family toxin [Armatimonadetes bacterium CG07_land_8_20_14_0_80_59_28]
MKYLTRAEIVGVNRVMIRDFGGLYTAANENLANAASLDYVQEAVMAEMFGQQLYPSVWEKAAAYSFHIIQGHVFSDGNKRTGMESAFLFMEQNRYVLKDEVTSKDVVGLALDIACESMTLKDFAGWLQENTCPIL